MTYNNSIPQSSERPSDSQTELLGNFQALKTYLDRNHVAIATPSGDVDEGKHKFCQFPVQATIPAGLIATDATIYSKAVSGNSEMFFSPDASGDEYQLTTSSSANIATFGTNTTYVANNNGGWTFLAGGLIMMYGRRTSPGSSGTVTFPFAFPSGSAPFSITLANERGSARATGYDGASSTGFTYYSETAGSTAINWIAIGN